MCITIIYIINNSKLFICSLSQLFFQMLQYANNAHTHHTHPYTRALCFVTYKQLFKITVKSESKGVYSTSLLSLVWFLQRGSMLRSCQITNQPELPYKSFKTCLLISYWVHITPHHATRPPSNMPE